jgi:hypothetical protein
MYRSSPLGLLGDHPAAGRYGPLIIIEQPWAPSAYRVCFEDDVLLFLSIQSPKLAVQVPKYMIIHLVMGLSKPRKPE